MSYSIWFVNVTALSLIKANWISGESMELGRVAFEGVNVWAATEPSSSRSSIGKHLVVAAMPDGADMIRLGIILSMAT
jgi:hypothetical protein